MLEHSLYVNVCTDEHVAEKEDFTLLGFENLATFAVHRLDQRLAQDQRALI